MYRRARAVALTLAYALAVASCTSRESFGIDSTWDLVACTTDDTQGFGALETDYPPADLGGMDNARVLSASDDESNKSALGIAFVEADSERLNAIEERLEADPRVTSTHRRATLADACF